MLVRRLRTFALGLIVAFAATGWAQEPSGPPPPSGRGSDAGPALHELLPDIGRIGAEVALLGGASWNPYDVGPGAEAGGYIDLPLRRAPGGKLSYEIFLGLSLATSDPFTITSPVAYLANLATGASPDAALAGPPGAPFPVRRSVRTRLRLLHVSPFGFKYVLTGWDHVRLRPYVNAGADVLLVMTQQRPEAGSGVPVPVGAPLDDPLAGGLFAQAPELAARGTPTGEGNIALGGHAAAGVEIRLSGGVSLNLEYRFTATEGRNGRLHTASTALGFHW